MNNSLKTAKPSNKKGLFVPLLPSPVTFEQEAVPDWMALVLYDLVSSEFTYPIVHIKSFPKINRSLGLVYVDLESATEDPAAHDEYLIYPKTDGTEKKLLEDYLQTYESDKLPARQYKIFEKSMRDTIDVLCKGEERKGKKMDLDHILAPTTDVRFYSSLVYLWKRDLLDIDLPCCFQVRSNGTVANIEINLKVSARAMASRVLPPPPDAVYNGLKLFLDEKKLVYQGNVSQRLQSERPMCKILAYMMQHSSPVSLKKVRTKFSIVTTKNDPEARGKIDNFIYRANLRLHKVKFPQRLCITAKKICWKDVDI